MQENFIKWLQRQMDREGINQTELAERSGLYPSNISQVLSGDKNPGVDFFIKLAKGLRLPPGYIFEQYVDVTSTHFSDLDRLTKQTVEIMRILKGLGRDDDIGLIHDFAEMLLVRQENPETINRDGNGTS